MIIIQTVFINQSFFNGKRVGKFRSKPFECKKRLDLLTVNVLSGFYGTIFVFMNFHYIIQYWYMNYSIFLIFINTVYICLWCMFLACFFSSCRKLVENNPTKFYIRNILLSDTRSNLIEVFHVVYQEHSNCHM